jgi:UDP-glucose 4-epimerase
MNILVTGGAGYIGSHTIKQLLEKKHKIIVYDNLEYGHKEFIPKEVVFIHSNLSDYDKLNDTIKKYSINAIIHFAAYAYVGESVKNPSRYFNNNVSNGIKLLDAMVENKIKYIVFSSSCATYGTPKEIPITENCNQNPINPYGFTKLIFEKMLDYYENAYDIKSISLRYFNAAGATKDSSIGEKHNPETHIIPNLINNQTFEIYGNDYETKDGTCIRDYIHVIDLADAHIKALEYLIKNNKSEKLNLGTGKGISIFEIIKIFEEISKKKVNYIIKERREGDPPVLIADPSKAKKLLSWNPKYDIYDIIKDAYNWHSKDI